ncbi:MAG TPA: HlyD family secretion protein [Verrucomicrobiae bacterium]|jgi:membrane fusion protein (multidrug efflux system)
MNATTLSPANQSTARVNLPTAPLTLPTQNSQANRLGLNEQTEPPAPRKNRRPAWNRIAFAGLAVCVGLGLAAFAHHWWTVGRFIESTDDAYIGGDVTVIAPKVAGFISQLSVTDNQQVHAGDLLIKLDDRDYRTALAKAGAAVALQRAALTNLEATRHLQTAIVAQAQADITVADAEITRAHDDQIRYKHLVIDGTVSAQSFENADTAYTQAVANGEKSRAGLLAAQQQLEVIATQKQQAQAALDAAGADFNLAQLYLDYTELRAPIDGVIGNRSAQVGAYATVGAQLISLVPSHGLWIDANFKENQLARMHAGSPATVQIDLLGGKKFHGHVVSIAPATGAQFSVLPAENATGNFTKIVQRVAVRIQLDDESAALGQLRPGLSVTVKVDTK